MDKKTYSFLNSFCLFVNTSIVKTIAISIISLYPCNLLAQNITENNTELPTPKGNPNQLFYLQRAKNTNTVIYELHKINSVLDLKNPIHIYWIMYASHEEHQELSTIEKKYAYGITIMDKGNEEYQFTLVAYPKITLHLKKDSTKNYHVYLTVSGKLMQLQKIFIKEKEGGFSLNPTVEYIDFFGIDEESGKEMNERIKM